MSKHNANAVWQGNLARGKGVYTLKSNEYKGEFSFTSRFEDDKKSSSPEELIAAAHASCFSMAFSHLLDQSGYKPEKVETDAEVTLSKVEGSFAITEIVLKTKGHISGIEEEKFTELASKAKENCPVSKALKGTNIKLKAELM